MSSQLVVLDGLELEARRLFIASASQAVDKATGHIELDCARLDRVEEPTLGMLVTVARFAQRRGQRVVLNQSSKRVRSDLDDAGVSFLFAWSA